MGLLGGIARTAVFAGTWTAASNEVSRRQSRRWSQQGQPQLEEQYAQQFPPDAAFAPGATAPPQPPPAAAASAREDRLEQLKELGDLKTQGVLTEEEFAAEKARILGQ